jgi:hypothetical protein
MKPWSLGFNVHVHRRPRTLRSLVLVLLAGLLAGCGSTEAPAEPATTSGSPDTTAAEAQTEPEPVGGLVADLGTNRLYVVDRAFGLGLRNVGDVPVAVQAMQLDSPQFATLPATPREVTLEPGRRLVLPLPYGEVRCDVALDGTFGVTLMVDGEELHLDAVEEFDGAVARFHARECAAADVRERVDITFGDEWTRDGIEITGELRLEQRHPGEPVALDDAVGNVIFTLVLEQAHPVLRVSDDAPSASLPVTISADRCDPHAVAEFKRPYVFLSWVAVGDGEPVPVELELTGGARAALDGLIAACSV